MLVAAGPWHRPNWGGGGGGGGGVVGTGFFHSPKKGGNTKPGCVLPAPWWWPRGFPGITALDWLIFQDKTGRRLAGTGLLISLRWGLGGAQSASCLLSIARRSKGSVAAAVARASTFFSAARAPERMAPSTHPP